MGHHTGGNGFIHGPKHKGDHLLVWDTAADYHQFNV